MTNSAPTTFDTSRIVTLADIIDDGNIDKTADFGINEHLDLIEKIEAEGAVATDLSDAQLDNLAAYFTSLTGGLAMKLWSLVGASSENNAIGLHCLTGDFLMSILEAGTPETSVRTPLQGCMTLAEHTEQAELAKEQAELAKEQAKRDKEQAKEQAKQAKEQKIIDELNAWAQERSERRALDEQDERDRELAELIKEQKLPEPTEYWKEWERREEIKKWQRHEEAISHRETNFRILLVLFALFFTLAAFPGFACVFWALAFPFVMVFVFIMPQYSCFGVLGRPSS